MNDPRLKELKKWRGGSDGSLGDVKDGLNDMVETVNALVRANRPLGSAGESDGGVPQRMLATVITAEGGIVLQVFEGTGTLGAVISSESDLGGLNL